MPETTTEAESFADDLDTLLLRHPSTPVGNVHRMLSDASATLRSIAARIQELEAEVKAERQKRQEIDGCAESTITALADVLRTIRNNSSVTSHQIEMIDGVLGELTSTTEGEQHG